MKSFFSFFSSKLFLCLLLGLFSFPIYAQNNNQFKQKKDQLQTEMKKLQREIQEMEKLAQSTSLQKKENQNALNLLKKNIQNKQHQIKGFGAQINSLENNIVEKEENIDEKTDEADETKSTYASLLKRVYSQMQFRTQWHYLTSSSFFNKTVTNIGYLNKLSGFKSKEAKTIEQNILVMESEKGDLEKSKAEKERLLKIQASQVNKLVSEKEKTDNTIALLSEKEKKIKDIITQKNRAAQELNFKIEKAIQQEIALARKRAQEAAAKKRAEAEAEAKRKNPKALPPKNTPKPKEADEDQMLTPKEQELSQDFVSNRGRLPWPTAKGNISSRFGKQEHATIKGVFIENNGVDIQTTAGSQARAIFGGTVVSIFSMPTTQTCIIIKHGDYFTVYSNIQSPTVHPNETVNTKQSLGTLYTDPNDHNTKVHLEIWHGKDKLDPLGWIGR